MPIASKAAHPSTYHEGENVTVFSISGTLSLMRNLTFDLNVDFLKTASDSAGLRVRMRFKIRPTNGCRSRKSFCSK